MSETQKPKRGVKRNIKIDRWGDVVEVPGELADREEQSDKARMAEHLKMLKLKRREAAE